MASTPVRVTDELLERLDARADGRGRAEMVQEAIERYLNPQPGQGINCLIELSKSQIACMDQLADRSRLTRKQWIEKVLGAKLRHEFVFERQAQLADLSHG
jgi:predicted transcriptional regulator